MDLKNNAKHTGSATNKKMVSIVVLLSINKYFSFAKNYIKQAQCNKPDNDDGYYIFHFVVHLLYGL